MSVENEKRAQKVTVTIRTKLIVKRGPNGRTPAMKPDLRSSADEVVIDHASVSDNRRSHGTELCEWRIAKKFSKNSAGPARPLGIGRRPDGKMRVTSGSCNGDMVVLKNRILDYATSLIGSHVTRKTRCRDHSSTGRGEHPYGPAEKWLRSDR